MDFSVTLSTCNYDMSKNVDRLTELHLFKGLLFFLSGYVFAVVVFHRVEAKTIFEGRLRNTRKNTAKLLQGLQARITK